MSNVRIDQIDKNLAIESSIKKDGLVWHDVRDLPFDLYNTYEKDKKDMPLHRIPTDVAEATSLRVSQLNFNTAGVHARFCTNSPYIAIKCEWDAPLNLMTIMPLTGSRGFDLYRDTAVGSKYIRSFVPPAKLGITGYDSVLDVNAEGKETRYYTLNFPIYSGVKNLYIGIKEGSTLDHGKPYIDKTAVFYGSSITQGGCCSRPGNTYEAQISRRFNIFCKNLGFSGNARGEDAIADYIASLDKMDIFFCDYDFNAPDAAHLKTTHESMYRKIRAKHPDMPYVFVSAPVSYYYNFRKDRRMAIYSVYEMAMKEGDKNVYFINGEQIFDGDSAAACTVEGVHPNDLGFFRMYERFSRLIGQIIGE